MILMTLLPSSVYALTCIEVGFDDSLSDMVKVVIGEDPCDSIEETITLIESGSISLGGAGPWLYNDSTNIFFNDSYANQTLDERWVNEDGDNMTGDLNMTGNNIEMNGGNITHVTNISGNSPIGFLDEIIVYENAQVRFNLTVDDHIYGNLSWSNLSDYPQACPPGQLVTSIGDNLTCAAPVVNDQIWNIDGSKYIYNRTDLGPNGGLDVNETALNATIANVTAPKIFLMNITTSGGSGDNLSIAFSNTINNFFITPTNLSSTYKFKVFLNSMPSNPILKANQYTGALSYLTPFGATEAINVTLTNADDDTYEVRFVYE
jgi:hypothetical protein